VVSVSRQSGAATLVAARSTWRYSDTRGDLGAAWRQPGYNDVLWSAGPAPLGAGDGHIATQLNLGPDGNRTITHYFRRQFTLGTKADVSSLLLRLMRDDGAVVYLNGVEVFRSNMPDGAIGYSTPSVYVVAEPEETQFFETPVDPALLVEGANTLAVEIHQCNTGSSDLTFDLELLGDVQAPLATRVLGVEPVSASERQFRAAFPVEAGRTYSVLYRDNVATGPWSKLRDFPAAAEPSLLEWLEALPDGATNRFYRVVTPAVP
jgi:hypothetical protein